MTASKKKIQADCYDTAHARRSLSSRAHPNEARRTGCVIQLPQDHPHARHEENAWIDQVPIQELFMGLGKCDAHTI